MDNNILENLHVLACTGERFALQGNKYLKGLDLFGRMDAAEKIYKKKLNEARSVGELIQMAKKDIDLEKILNWYSKMAVIGYVITSEANKNKDI